MHWFYRDEVTDPANPEVLHRQYTCVVAIGSHASGTDLLLAGEGWGTQGDHEGHGWVYDGVKATPPALPAVSR